jgi:hypothetical protein
MRAGLVPLLAGWPDSAALAPPATTHDGAAGGGGGACAVAADAPPLCWTDALFDGDALDVPLVGDVTLWEAMILESGVGAEPGGLAAVGSACERDDVDHGSAAPPPPLLPPRQVPADGLRCLDATHGPDCGRCVCRALAAAAAALRKFPADAASRRTPGPSSQRGLAAAGKSRCTAVRAQNVTRAVASASQYGCPPRRGGGATGRTVVRAAYVADDDAILRLWRFIA